MVNPFYILICWNLSNSSMIIIPTILQFCLLVMPIRSSIAQLRQHDQSYQQADTYIEDDNQQDHRNQAQDLLSGQSQSTYLSAQLGQFLDHNAVEQVLDEDEQYYQDQDDNIYQNLHQFSYEDKSYAEDKNDKDVIQDDQLSKIRGIQQINRLNTQIKRLSKQDSMDDKQNVLPTLQFDQDLDNADDYEQFQTQAQTENQSQIQSQTQNLSQSTQTQAVSTELDIQNKNQNIQGVGIHNQQQDKDNILQDYFVDSQDAAKLQQQELKQNQQQKNQQDDKLLEQQQQLQNLKQEKADEQLIQGEQQDKQDQNYGVQMTINYDPYVNIYYIFKINKQVTSTLNGTISYDRYVDIFKANDYRWKDPEVIFDKGQVLKQNVERVKEHNSQNSSYTIGLNKYSHLTIQQGRQRLMSGERDEPVVSQKSQNKIRSIISSNNNFTVDWQCYDPTSYDQEQCETTFIFAVLNSIEITMRLHKFDISSLSVQEILSCMPRKDAQNDVCSQGEVSQVFQYIIKNGVGPASIYEYDDNAKQGKISECNEQITDEDTYIQKKVKIYSFQKIKAGDCSQVIYRLRFRALVGAIDYSQLENSKDKSGVIVIDTKKPKQELVLNHYVTIVGYDSNTQYFKVKNFWGHDWAMNGYAWVTKNTGLCESVYYPTISMQQPIPTPCQSPQKIIL